MTNKEKVISFLKEKRGAIEVKSKSSKYVKLESLEWSTYYVGNHGAVRRGKNIKDSFSITEDLYEIMRYYRIDI